METKTELKGQNESAKWYRGMFNMDTFTEFETKAGPFDGYTNGDNWNGWATPRLTKQAALSLVQAFNRAKPGTAEYVKASDTFRFTQDDTTLNEQDNLTPAQLEADGGVPMVDEYKGETYMVDGNTLTLYAIGSYRWTWNVARMGYYKCHSCDSWLRGENKAAHATEKHPGKEAFGLFGFLGFPSEIQTE